MPLCAEREGERQTFHDVEDYYAWYGIAFGLEYRGCGEGGCCSHRVAKELYSLFSNRRDGEEDEPTRREGASCGFGKTCSTTPRKSDNNVPSERSVSSYFPPIVFVFPVHRFHQIKIERLTDRPTMSTTIEAQYPEFSLTPLPNRLSQRSKA